MNKYYQLLLQSLVLIAAFVIPQSWNAQTFRNTYAHLKPEDHAAMIKNISGHGYIQVSTTTTATSTDIRLLKINSAGVVVDDFVNVTGAVNEHALDICIGNNDSYVICGYETVGGIDKGFVMEVDSSFTFLNKVYIELTPGIHTPALRVINSAFFEKNNPNPTPYWPGDPIPGYLVVGFEAVGYGTTQAKSGYVLKLSNTLGISWQRKFDSPVGPGGEDWDMCSNANWMWVGPLGYLVGGSSTAPSGAQCAMVALLGLNGSVVWSQRYTDSNAPGDFCVSADGAFDDAEFEFYHLANFSTSRSGAIIAFNQSTGAINTSRTRYLQAATNDYYAYEFASSCASQTIYISGFGHNQTAPQGQGYFPYVIRYDKNTPTVDTWGPRFAYPVQSTLYNPPSTIFSPFSTTAQPRIYYPKHLASRQLNIWAVSSYEDNGATAETHIIRPHFNGKDSCSYIYPGIQPVPISILTYPLNTSLGNYSVTPGSGALTAEPQVVYDCCAADANFTYSAGANCNYTFTATGPSTVCSAFTITDVSNNVLALLSGTTASYQFSQNGTYIVCYSACDPGLNGVVCRREKCETLVVNCPNPCSTLDATFSVSVNGCSVTVTDLSPEGNPYGCESWVFGNNPAVFAGDVTAFNFGISGTYTICHSDCITLSDGTVCYDTKCVQVTVNCTPPCCLPNNFNVTAAGNCCRQFTPVFSTPGCSSWLYFWNFGDGNFSWQQNPVHCYAGSGLYTVTLKAWCSKTQSITLTKTIKVKCALTPPPPCCNSTARMAYETNGMMLRARNQSLFSDGTGASSVMWNWGDGTSPESGDERQHYYQRPGTYIVSMTISGVDAGGQSFTQTKEESITVNLTPACTCSPSGTMGFAGSPVVCRPSGNSTELRIADRDVQAGVRYQWMSSETSGGPYTEIPGAYGLLTWADGVDNTRYFICKSTCLITGATSYSQEVDVRNGHFDAVTTATPAAICLNGSSSLNINAPGAIRYEWFPNSSTASMVSVSPSVTTIYEVAAFNAIGCGAEDTATVTLNPCFVPGNDGPSTAVNLQYSVNTNYPNCFPIQGNTFGAENSSESTEFAGNDVWYRFTAQSTAVSVYLNCTTADDAIALYSKQGDNYVLLASENAASGPTDFERLNYNGLTIGQQYFISVGGAGADEGGAFALCLQFLMPSACATAVPVGGLNLCNAYRALYRGAPSQGVTYSFNFAPAGETGGSPTSVSGTNGLITLSNPTLGLRYGGFYNTTVNVLYALANSAGTVEPITVNGTPLGLCSNVSIIAAPQYQVRTSQICPASLLRSNWLIGERITIPLCGVQSFTYEFTQIAGCNDGTVVSVQPAEYTRSGASPYLPLGVLQNLPSTGVWSVRIRPNFAYGSGTYGPARRIQVLNTSASGMFSEESLNSEERIAILDEEGLLIYPNPSNGDFINLSLSNTQRGELQLRVLDAAGRSVTTRVYAVEETFNTTVVFDRRLSAGVYLIEMTNMGSVQMRRLVVQ